MEFIEKVHSVIEENYLKFDWPDSDINNLKFKKLSGITNIVCMVTHLSFCGKDDIKGVIVKLFSLDQTSCLFDRESENKVCEELSQYGLGPKVYFHTQFLRIEELQIGETASFEDMQDFVFKKKMMVNFAILNEVDIKSLPKDSFFDDVVSGKKDFIGAVFKVFEEKPEKFNESETETVKKILDKIANKEELIWILDKLTPNAKHDLKFCHFDALSGNIMKIYNSSRVKFIDFEYAKYCYQGFDVADFLSETLCNYDHDDWPYFKIKAEKSFTESELRIFCLYYIFGLTFGSDLNSDTIDGISKLEDYEFLEQKLLSKLDKEMLTKKVDELVQNIKANQLLSKWYWALWSIISKATSDINFGYVEFGWELFKAYEKIKKHMM